MNKHVTPTDRFGLCRTLLIGAVLFVVLAFAILFIDTMIRTGGRPKGASLCRAVGLSNLALVPSGRALRTRETRTPAVDLRFAPHLPNLHSDPAEFLIASPQTVARKGQGQ